MAFLFLVEELYGFDINKMCFQLAHKNFNPKKSQFHLEFAFEDVNLWWEKTFKKFPKTYM
jgi:hypothetical protein